MEAISPPLLQAQEVCSSLADSEMFLTSWSLHKEFLPSCTVRATRGDTVQLADAILAGELDAAIVTLPLEHPQLSIHELRRDWLIVCLRRDRPLAEKSLIQISDLQGKLSILYHLQRHHAAHTRLMELFVHAGLQVEGYFSASHPAEMQMLVKEGYGVALIREGMALDEEWTVRRIGEGRLDRGYGSRISQTTSS